MLQMIKINYKGYKDARLNSIMLPYEILYTPINNVTQIGYDSWEGVYQLHNVQCITALSKEIKTLTKKRVVEICAGDGFLSYNLSLFNINIIATDDMSSKEKILYGNEVVTLDYKEAIKKYKPEVVLICWEPYKEGYVNEILTNKEFSFVKYIIVIGESPGGWTGNDTQWKHLIRELEDVSKYCICRTDEPFLRHSYCFLMGRKKK